MEYENLCMYCFEDMEGKTICPHCGRDSRAAVPQIQMLPGSRVYHERFLIGRALGQDATGIVYSAFDTKKENRLRIREYLPRDCSERLNDGAVVPIAGMEDQFEAGIRKLRASVESVEDPRKRHFFFEENGTAYIAQRKSAAAVEKDSEPEEEEEQGGRRRVLLFAGVAVAVLLVAAILLITVFNGAVPTNRDLTQSPTLDPDQVWIPLTTPTATPYVAPTFAALVDPELSWMDYTYDGDVEKDYQRAQQAAITATPTAAPTVKADSSKKYSLINGSSSSAEIRNLQQRLSELGWLESDQVTGKYDGATRQAVRAFQSYINEHYDPKQPLSVDGAAGPKTQQWLYEAYAQKPTATPRPRVTPKADEDGVDSRSSASRVRQVQEKLITLGLLPASAADGKYGATTAEAVRRFQARVNQLAGYDVLEVTGRMDAQSLAFLDYYSGEWEKLRQATAEPTATPRPTARPTATPTTRPVEVLDGAINGNSSREDIRKVQQLLADIGMLPQRGVDGVYGSATISAVADFQQWVNDQRNEETLTVNGEVDQLTLLYLQYCKDHGMMPYGTPTPRPTEVPTAQPTEEPFELVERDAPEEGEETQEINIDESSETESIRYVQEMLSAVGAMDASGIDGVYGNGTVSAVKRFQRWVNSVQGEGTLPVTGKVDNRTRLALEYAYDHELRIGEEDELYAEPTEIPEEVPTEVPTAVPTEVPTQTPTETPTPQPLVPVTEEPEEEEPEGPEEITVDENSEEESIRFVQEMLSATGLLDDDHLNGEYDSATTDAVRRFQAWVNSARGDQTLPENGKLDDLTRRYLEYAFEHEMKAEESEPESEPEAEPEPEATEAPSTGQVGSVEIAFDDSRAGDDIVSISEGRVSVRWRAEGEVQSYYVHVEDSAGNTIVDQKNTRDTSFTIDTDRMIPGEVYTMRLGVLPERGGEEDILWKTARFTLPESEPEPLVPVTEEEPEEIPVEEPDEELPEETEPEVGVVSAPDITIAGVAAGSSTIQIEDDSFQISWGAGGDVETYYVRILDGNGDDVMEPRYTTQTGTSLRSVELEEGEVYTLAVGAVPVNGTQEDMLVSRAKFMRPVQQTPEPTEAPTPEPEVARIGTPVVNVGGSAYQQDGISYMTDSSIIISWSADGDVESYSVFVENQSGERQELETMTKATSRTVNTGSLPAGIYTIYVGALPSGGGEEDIVWGRTRFGIPAPPEPVEEPNEDDWEDDAPDGELIGEDEPEGDEPEGDGYEGDDGPEEDEPEAMSIGPISGDSDANTVQQLQLRLYSLGLLSTDGLEPGVLDAPTLRAVAEFQTRMNEQREAGFDVVDPGDLSSVVDAATVSAIFNG